MGDDGGLFKLGLEVSLGVLIFVKAPLESKGLAREGLKGVICALAEVAEVVAVKVVVPVI